jgi:hypothetical protein
VVGRAPGWFPTARLDPTATCNESAHRQMQGSGTPNRLQLHAAAAANGSIADKFA